MLAQRGQVLMDRRVQQLPSVPALARQRLQVARTFKPAAAQPRQWQPLQFPARPLPTCSAASTSGPAQETRQQSSQALQGLRAPVTGMAKGLGSFSGGATLQRSKLNQSQKQKSWEFKTDDSGGGGIGGKGIFNGGGGGDDGGDDDDYFGDFDDGEGGDGGDGSFFRSLIREEYGRAAIAAVLSEWYQTFETLPLILRQAVQMGLFSSAQLTRFCAMDQRPTITRTVARSLPSSLSRGLVGRMMADPAFTQKMLMETTITGISSLWYEAQQRGERFGRELDLVAINTLSLVAANAALVWTLAPNRSFGARGAMPWQQWFSAMPSNCFDMSTPQRSFTNSSRAASFVTKGVELAGIGAAAGAVMALAGSASTALRQRFDASYQPSVSPVRADRAVLGLAAFMGISGNIRYQLISGFDRCMFNHSTFLWSYLTGSSLLRVFSHSVARELQLHELGLPKSPPARQPQPQQQQRAQLSAQARLPPRPAAQPGAPRPKTKKRVKKPVDKGFALSAGAAA